VKTVYRKRFLKDLAALPSPIRTQVEHFVFEEVPQASALHETGRAERMTGYPGCYKARFGSYRVGMVLEADALAFERVLHRKEIYRKFP
jgi:mRNA interferase RelE/StbE